MISCDEGRPARCARLGAWSSVGMLVEDIVVAIVVVVVG